MREERRRGREKRKERGEENNFHAGFSETFSNIPRQSEHDSACVIFVHITIMALKLRY